MVACIDIAALDVGRVVRACSGYRQATIGCTRRCLDTDTIINDVTSTRAGAMTIEGGGCERNKG